MKQAFIIWHRKTPGERVFIVLNGFLLLVFSVIVLYPLIYQAYNSLFLYHGVVYYPHDYSQCTRVFSFEMWRVVLLHEGFLRFFFNSVARTIIGTALSLCLTTFLAFILSRREIRWRYKMSFFWALTFYLDAGMVPRLIYYKAIGLAPSFWVYVIPGAINAIYLVVLRTYMEHLPPELDEAAILDGAGYRQRFTEAVLPQCKPIVATVALFTASTQWYSWLDSLLYNRLNIEYDTLAYQYFKNSPLVMEIHVSGTIPHPRALDIIFTVESRESVLFCMLCIPILFFSVFCRKYYMTDIKFEGVKS